MERQVSYILAMLSQYKRGKGMEQLLNERTIFTIMASIGTWVLAGFDQAFLILVCLVILDYITGMIKAFVNKDLSSSQGYKGIYKKIGIFVAVCVAFLVDAIIGSGSTIRVVSVYWFVFMESISILENLQASGVVLPDFLINRLRQFKDSVEGSTGDKIEGK